MDERLKQRLVGAAVLVLVAVIFIPMILDPSSEPSVRIEHPVLPPESETNFSSRIIPLTEPQTPLVEAERRRQPAPPPPPAEPVEPEEPEATVTAAVKSPEVKKEAPPAPEPAPPPAAPTEKSAPTAWAIQLGSFSSAKNAMALRDRLREKGYVAFIESAKVNGKEITRVFVGPDLARKRAEELVKKLHAETELKGMVVQYPGS